MRPNSLTSDLGLQAADNGHGLVQDHQLGLGLLALQVVVADLPQLLEGFINVTDTHSG